VHCSSLEHAGSRAAMLTPLRRHYNWPLKDEGVSMKEFHNRVGSSQSNQWSLLNKH
jgi:hypothetical protein